MAGFGASGRNGGWCSALFPGRCRRWQPWPADVPGARPRSPSTARCAQSVEEVARAAALEGIDAHVARGGTITLARSPAQWSRAQAEVAEARQWGRGDDDLRLLAQDEAVALLHGTRTLGATYTPDCAALHPARLVRGLAEAVERRGVQIFERTRATSIAPGEVRTPTRDRAGRPRRPRHRGLHAAAARDCPRRRAGVLAGHRHRAAVAPRCGRRSGWPAARPSPTTGTSSSTASAPPTTGWSSAAAGRRTTSGRGCGPPTTATSASSPGSTPTLLDLFPVLRGTAVTHAWGGPLGIPRDWCASVGLDRRHRARLGRGLRRRRRQHQQPRRAHPARPHPRSGHRAHPAALGGPPLPRLGAGAAALVGHQRRAAGDEPGRRRGVGDRSSEPGSPSNGAPARLSSRTVAACTCR